MCWRTFVLACFYICNQAVTIADLAVIDYLLVKFCKEYEVLYGSNRIKPNMQMHGHLVASMKDFGPVYNFWLFSFEQYNGLLGSKPAYLVVSQITKKVSRSK